MPVAGGRRHVPGTARDYTSRGSCISVQTSLASRVQTQGIHGSLLRLGGHVIHYAIAGAPSCSKMNRHGNAPFSRCICIHIVLREYFWFGRVGNVTLRLPRSTRLEMR